MGSQAEDRHPENDTRDAITSALQQAVDLERVSALAMDHLARHFEGSNIGLALSATNQDPLKPIWASGDRDFIHSFHQAEGDLWSQAVELFSDPVSEPDHASLIWVKDQPIGVFIYQTDEARVQNLVRYIAAELGETAAYLRDITEAHRLHREMAILNAIARSLSTAMDLDHILQATISQLADLVQAEIGSLAVMDFDQQEPVFRRALTQDPDHISIYQPDLQRSIVGYCFRTMESMIVPDVHADPRYRSTSDGVDSLTIHSILCVPLLVRDRAIGVIELMNKIDGTFNQHDLELMVNLSASVGAAVENARLIHELTVTNADLAASRKEIEGSRSTLMAIFDHLEDELYIVNRVYDLIAVNRARSNRAGEDPRKLVGRKCYEALFHQEAPCDACRVMETFEGGIKTKRTERLQDSGHHAVERDIYSYPIHNSSGEVSRAILQLRDVTEQRRLEAYLVQAEKLAAMGQLAAGVAHELNNPITAVIANAQLMKRELEQGSVSIESLELVERAGHRAHDVVRDLLDFARQDRQEFALLDVNRSIRQTIALIKHQWATSNIQIHEQLSADLPQVLGNADHLQSVWLNLLVNARDALEDGPGEVQIRSMHRQELLTIQISDNGKGIPDELMDQIFEPFFTTKEPGKGTGLGLATCFRIIKEHGGTIDIDSVLDKGTTVTVVLPTVVRTE